MQTLRQGLWVQVVWEVTPGVTREWVGKVRQREKPVKYVYELITIRDIWGANLLGNNWEGWHRPQNCAAGGPGGRAISPPTPIPCASPHLQLLKLGSWEAGVEVERASAHHSCGELRGLQGRRRRPPTTSATSSTHGHTEWSVCCYVLPPCPYRLCFSFLHPYLKNCLLNKRFSGCMEEWMNE